MEKEFECTLHGKVQGTGYRVFIKEKADQIGVYGFVSNNEDGTVTVVAQGEEDKLIDFLSFVRRGPFFARIDDIEVEWADKQRDAYPDFSIE